MRIIKTNELEIPLYKIPVQEINLTKVDADWTRPRTSAELLKMLNAHTWLWHLKLCKDIDLN